MLKQLPKPFIAILSGQGIVMGHKKGEVQKFYCIIPRKINGRWVCCERIRRLRYYNNMGQVVRVYMQTRADLWASLMYDRSGDMPLGVDESRSLYARRSF